MRNKATSQMLVQPLISHYYVKISKTTSVIFLYLCRKRSRVNCKRVECGPPLCFTISGVRYVIHYFQKWRQGVGKGLQFHVHGFKKNIIRPISNTKICHQYELSVVLTIRLGGIEIRIDEIFYSSYCDTE